MPVKRATRTIKVEDITLDEQAALTRALELPDVRAFAIICGILEPLNQRGRQRVMTFIGDRVDEEHATPAPREPPRLRMEDTP